MLDVIDYDVILEMDFLSKYEAMINCKAETVSLKTPEMRCLRSPILDEIVGRCLFWLCKQKSG